MIPPDLNNQIKHNAPEQLSTLRGFIFGWNCVLRITLRSA